MPFSLHLLYFIVLMSFTQSSESPFLSMKAVTWLKDSHSLFDYQFNKNVIQNTHQYAITDKFTYIYRNNSTSQISFKKDLSSDYEEKSAMQLLGGFQITQQQNQKHRMEFYSAKQIREKGQSSGAMFPEVKEEELYLIVRSLKTKNNQNKGYKMVPGQIIKLGRVEYLVSSLNNSPYNAAGLQAKSKFWQNNKKIQVDSLPMTQQGEPLQCKYCMLGQGRQHGQFLCTPCKCSGTCALVHFSCLQKWNQSKVKKQVVGGTIQYNFQKFFCQVCKQEYPRFVVKDGQEYQLLPIEKPSGSYIILEGITQKSNNMMVIQNVPAQGIKIGRGHECEIRITDISVSRTHARIEKVGQDYIVYDNKSKFGTLVKEERLVLDLNKIKQGIQIGRTVITFEKVKKNS